MCQGLAVVAEKVNDEWIVYAKEGVKSHDDLLHILDDGLRCGSRPHLKFEIYFPMIINDDIQQDVAEKYYPEGWVEKRFGKWVACPDAFGAVAKHLCENKDLLNFDPSLLDHASLDGASLNDASLNGASLNEASLDGASLNRASLDGASLNDASLDGASLNRASLNRASLDGASLNRASLNRASLDGASLTKNQVIKFWVEINVAIFERLNIDLKLKTRKEVEEIISEAGRSQ